MFQFILQKNIIFKIFTFLNIYDRYNFSISNSSIYYKFFCNFFHSKFDNCVFNINNTKSLDYVYYITKKWYNIFYFSLNLSGKYMIDCNKLVFLHSLDLSYSDVKYVNNLKNLKKLNLTCCSRIKNISELNNVDYLNLTSCFNITNKSFINKNNLINNWNNKYLCFSWNSNISNISIFKNVKSLNFYNCNQITNISNLKNHYYLNLSLTKIIDISNLNNINTLILNYTNIKYIPYFKNLKTLEISHCQNIKKLYVNDLLFLNISYCKNIIELHINKNILKLNKLLCNPNLKIINNIK